MNPLLLLGLVETAVDPEYVATIRTIAEARMHCPFDFWASDLFPLANGLVDSPPSSPAAVLLDRIQRLGFTVCPDGTWTDEIGSFHPGQVNFAELTNRVQWQWNKVVANVMGYRKDFSGLDKVDPTATRLRLAKMAIDDQAYLRLSLSGGLFTQDAHSHWNEQDGGCKWCGQPDSLQHRYFECPQTADLRLSLAPDVCRLRGLLPDAMVLRSWAILPPTRLQWLRMLASVPVGVPPTCCALDLTRWNHVFTDGSCFWQANPSYRLAAWGAILAVPAEHSWLVCPVQVLGSGPLAGLCQTAYRGELFALAWVLHHAACVGARVKVYSDCLGVVTKQKYTTLSLQEQPRPNPLRPVQICGIGFWNLWRDLDLTGFRFTKLQPTNRCIKRAINKRLGRFGITTRLTRLQSERTQTAHRCFGKDGVNTLKRYKRPSSYMNRLVLFIWLLRNAVHRQRSR